MCGLAGVAGYITQNDEKTFKDLLLFSQVRGFDSTGIGAVTRVKDPDTYLIKDTATATDFLMFDKRVDKLFTRQLSVLIGHCRAATRGHVTKKNAHPFLANNILGAHNGTLSYTTQEIHKKTQDCGTDSEGLFYEIDSKGAEAAIKGMAQADAYALSWYNLSDRTINLCHNVQRPLYYSITEDGKALYWASEFGLIYAAAHRNNVKLGDVVDLPINQIYSWKVPTEFASKYDAPLIIPAAPERVDHQTAKVYNYTGGVFGRKGAANAGGPFTDDKKTQTTTGGGTGGIKNSVGFAHKNEKGDVIYSRFDSQSYRDHTDNTPIPPPPAVQQGCKVLYNNVGRGTKLLFDTTRQAYLTHTWNSSQGRWVILRQGGTPTLIPFNVLDINSRHEFKIVKQKVNGVKERVAFYKGFGGRLLSKEDFEEATVSGCSCCGRIPMWGNRVNFYDPDQHFVCEYCGEMHDLPILTKILSIR